MKQYLHQKPQGNLRFAKLKNRLGFARRDKLVMQRSYGMAAIGDHSPIPSPTNSQGDGR
jgi:hypothetical protein